MHGLVSGLECAQIRQIAERSRLRRSCRWCLHVGCALLARKTGAGAAADAAWRVGVGVRDRADHLLVLRTVDSTADSLSLGCSRLLGFSSWAVYWRFRCKDPKCQSRSMSQRRRQGESLTSGAHSRRLDVLSTDLAAMFVGAGEAEMQLRRRFLHAVVARHDQTAVGAEILWKHDACQLQRRQHRD